MEIFAIIVMLFFLFTVPPIAVVIVALWAVAKAWQLAKQLFDHYTLEDPPHG